MVTGEYEVNKDTYEEFAKRCLYNFEKDVECFGLGEAAQILMQAIKCRKEKEDD